MSGCTCKECKKDIKYGWCRDCNAKHFRKNWSSGNVDIDKFIQYTQLSANRRNEVLEWIPYNKFDDIKYIAKGGFGKVYRAIWIDGYIWNWDDYCQDWKRYGQSKYVALKSLSNSKNVSLEFINEITLHHKIGNNDFIVPLYGITQDPETKNYMMVMDYAYYGSLRDLIYNKLSWKIKFGHLLDAAKGLCNIHEKGLIHRDLHIGNILSFTYRDSKIADMGLCKPADYNELENTNNNTDNDNVYGVLPCIAPEILGGQNYTKASDIYSFGIIMYEVISGLPPYHDVSHDENLAMKICLGLRPRFNMKVPKIVLDLIKRCLDTNPLNRPQTHEVNYTLWQWYHEFDEQTELKKQIKEADYINNSLLTNRIISPASLSSSYKTHPGAIYTSRLLNFNNLPKPKNSYDYYDEQNDDIISKKYSESLQIDISKLKMDIQIDIDTDNNNVNTITSLCSSFSRGLSTSIIITSIASLAILFTFVLFLYWLPLNKRVIV